MQSAKLRASKGWSALDGIQPNPQDADREAKAREFASMIRSTFEDTDQGKVVLDTMIQQYLTKPVVRPDDSQFAAGIREGRADVVRSILQQIEFAKAE